MTDSAWPSLPLRVPAITKNAKRTWIALSDFESDAWEPIVLLEKALRQQVIENIRPWQELLKSEIGRAAQSVQTSTQGL
jgi:hypothetical protein